MARDLIDRVLSGDTRAAARLLRFVDERSPGYEPLLRELYPNTGSAWLVGITGTPGAGKSTLVSSLVAELRQRGHKVGVIAVDPSSPFTAGAVLGDRIRMQRHSQDPGVFIRSCGTRGKLGGLCRSAAESARVLEAWGASVVIIETVGVGQDEVDVVHVADSTVVVCAPGLGDDVQAVKAGILECADVLVVNKADRDGADATVADLEGMLALGHTSVARHHGPAHVPQGAFESGASRSARAREPGGEMDSAWVVPVLRTVATQERGVVEVLAALEAHREHVRAQTPVRRRIHGELEAVFLEELTARARSELGQHFAEYAQRVASGSIDPYTASRELLDLFRAAPALGRSDPKNDDPTP